MKIAILSDVHGNLPALRAVLDCVNEVAPDAVIVAGDLIGGPDFNETTSILDEIGSWMILGNMDLDLLKFIDGDFSREKRGSRQWSFMRWHAHNAKNETIDLLRELPIHREVSLGGMPTILVVHGSPRSPYESLFPDKKLELLDNVVEEMAQPVLVCGHIHIQWSRRISGKLVLNPGAVSSPLQGDLLSRFSILIYENESWAVEHKAVEYDVGELNQRYHESGLYKAGGAVSKAFLMACETGIDVARPFYNFALEKANKAALGPDEFIPDDVWMQAEEEFPWNEFA
jgi:putative phosphoesterase